LDRLGFTFLSLALVLGAPLARAATVAIVRPANPPPAMTETLVRLQGELTSVGLATEIIDGSIAEGGKGRESRSWLEQLAVQRGVDAVVAIVGDASPDTVEVWVIDKVTGKSVVRRVPFEPRSARAPETLAIRAIELLRSSFLEIDLAAGERRGQSVTAPPAAVVHFMEMERLASRPERFGVAVGGAVVMSLDGVGPAVLPLVRFEWAVRSWLVVQAALAGLGTRPTVQSGTSSAQVAQEYGVLGASYWTRGGQRLHPFVALSAGALHTSVEGRADTANQGRHADQWSFLLDGGLGASLRLRDRYYLAVAAHAQMAEPYVAIRFVDDVVATSARPNILLTFTLGAWL
jgi:hypothetical protein